MPPRVTNNTYVRSPFVDMGNSLNVLGAPLDLSGVFDSGIIVVSSEFLFLPLLFLITGLVLYLILVLVHTCQYMCCCECKQKVFQTSQVDLIKDILFNYQNCCSATFYTICIYMMLAVQLIIWQRGNALDGVKSAFDFSRFLVDEYAIITNTAVTLSTSTSVMVADVTSATATPYFKGNFTKPVLGLQNEAKLYQSGLTYMRSFLSFFHDSINEYLGNDYLNNFVILGCYLVPIFCAAVLGVSHWYRNKVGVRFFLVAGSITYLLALVMSFVFLSATLVLANICMNPLSRLRDMTPPVLQPTFVYYATCFTANPLQNHTNYALSQLTAIDTMYNTSFRRSHPVAAFAAHKVSTRSAILATQNAISCPFVRSHIASFVQDAICSKMYTFSYCSWVAMQCCSVFMFLLFLIGMAAYQFESEEQIDDFVETHYSLNSSLASLTFGSLSRGGGDGSPGKWKSNSTSSFSPGGRRSGRVADFDEEKSVTSSSEHRPAATVYEEFL